MISTIYFDLGGVVFYDFFSGGAKTLAENMGMPEQRVYDAYTRTDLPAYSVGQLTDLERWTMFAEELDISSGEMDVVVKSFYNTYKVIEPTVALLRDLKANFPGVNRGVLSDQPCSVARMLRKQYEDVFSLFDDDFILISAEAGLSKRNPDLSLFKLAFERSGATGPKIMYVDDSTVHLANAAKVGIPGFHFDIKSQSPVDLAAQIKHQLTNHSSSL